MKIKSAFDNRGIEVNTANSLKTQSSSLVRLDNSFKFKRRLWDCKTCKLDALTLINDVKEYKTAVGLDAITILMLSYTPKKGEVFNSKSWAKISSGNIYKYKEYFDEIISWFFLEKYSDMFYTSDGHLYFNGEYKAMELILSDGYMGKISRLKAKPNVITYFNREYEGIVLFIDNSSNICEISLESLRSLRHILETFSFQAELQLAIQIMNMKGEKK